MPLDKVHKVISVVDGNPTFKVSLPLILSELGVGWAIKLLSPAEYITDAQRQWYKGVCLPNLVKNDENGETEGW